jgi:mRNA interferase HigB
VHIVTQKHLHEAMETYKDAAEDIKAWTEIVKGARWHKFQEVRSIFKDADHVDDYVIFNIRHNRYRLVTVIHWGEKGKADRWARLYSVLPDA